MSLRDRLRRRFRRDADLDEEIGAHLGMAARDRVDRGEEPAEARSAVLREFGNPQLVKEVTRDAWGRNIVERLGRDLRYAGRMAPKNPAFSAVVVLTLALGVGANTAIFSVVHAAMAPLNITGPERAVMVWTENPSRDWHRFPASVPDYRDWGPAACFPRLADSIKSA